MFTVKQLKPKKSNVTKYLSIYSKVTKVAKQWKYSSTYVRINNNTNKNKL